MVSAARQAIQARGETPIALAVEPGGSEFSQPAQQFISDRVKLEEPDPDGLVFRDQEGLIEAEITVIPPKVSAGGVARVYVSLRPNLTAKGHWNNEAEDTVLWIKPQDGWNVNAARLTIPKPAVSVSQETRSFEFEVKAPRDPTFSIVSLPAYALYYVCEDIHGTCLYRRQDINIDITTKED